MPGQPVTPYPEPAPQPTPAPEPGPDVAPDPSPAPAQDPPPAGDEPRAFARTPSPPLERPIRRGAQEVPIYGDMWGTGAEARPYDLPGLAPTLTQIRPPLSGPQPGPGQFSAGSSAAANNPSEPPAESAKP
jgi:hypothetical protein